MHSSPCGLEAACGNRAVVLQSACSVSATTCTREHRRAAHRHTAVHSRPLRWGRWGKDASSWHRGVCGANWVRRKRKRSARFGNSATRALEQRRTNVQSCPLLGGRRDIAKVWHRCRVCRPSLRTTHLRMILLVGAPTVAVLRACHPAQTALHAAGRCECRLLLKPV